MFQHILDLSAQENKNILIIGSARSGTHALGSQLSAMSPVHNYLGEICRVDHRPEPWKDIELLNAPRKIAHLVAFSSKVKLSGNVDQIKKNSLIVSLRRKDKVKQFSSWMYFHCTGGIDGKWHNHQSDDTMLDPGSIAATEFDIDQFLNEQMVDSFFCPDVTVYYENLVFDKSKYLKNSYKFDLPNIFSNLDYVKHRLGDWKYYSE